jgi:hypothetical protein
MYRNGIHADRLMTETREIRIPSDLYTSAGKKFGNRFQTVDELVVFLLQELISGDTTALDQADQQVIEERLRNLGYI